MSLSARQPLKQLLSLSFNQDASCFVVALDTGFRMFCCEPFSESHRREFESGGVAVAEMLFRSNIVALVGGGPVPKYRPDKVVIWDDHQGRPIGELAFRSPVRSVRLRKDRIAVALEHKVCLYDLEDLRLLQTVDTAPNPEGLLALSPAEGGAVLAAPGLHPGQLRVDCLDTKRIKIIKAHDSALAALALSHNGRLAATASEKGTLIRVWSTADGSQLREVRRGREPARIFSLAFSRESEERPGWLAATSDRGTAHVFSLTKRSSGKSSGESGEGGGNGNGETAGGAGTSGASGTPQKPKTGISAMKKSLTTLTKSVAHKVGGSYLSSEWSWAQYYLPDRHRCAVAFGRDPGTLLLASVTGAFHQVAFDPEKEGPCAQVAYTLFIDPESEGME